jgi:glycosyltransferase involved in cell wall biosynthesis
MVNDICGDLRDYVEKERSDRFEYVIDPLEADVIFTNDIYPQSLIDLKKPKVKRMDGIFWQRSLLYRNSPYASAAMVSDKVIFISRYSQQSAAKLYGKDWSVMNKSKVILNDAPEWIFYPDRKRRIADYHDDSRHMSFVACVSNWGREEKRLEALLSLIKYFKSCALYDNFCLHIIGECNCEPLPHFVTCHEYVEDREEIANIMRHSDAFLNFSYRDAAPKTVCQAVRCGLPVLYANSGGVEEIVDGRGMPIMDDVCDQREDFCIQDAAIPLVDSVVIESLDTFINNYSAYREIALSRQDPESARWTSYRKCLDGYLSVFEEVV